MHRLGHRRRRKHLVEVKQRHRAPKPRRHRFLAPIPAVEQRPQWPETRRSVRNRAPVHSIERIPALAVGTANRRLERALEFRITGTEIVCNSQQPGVRLLDELPPLALTQPRLLQPVQRPPQSKERLHDQVHHPRALGAGRGAHRHSFRLQQRRKQAQLTVAAEQRRDVGEVDALLARQSAHFARHPPRFIRNRVQKRIRGRGRRWAGFRRRFDALHLPPLSAEDLLDAALHLPGDRAPEAVDRLLRVAKERHRRARTAHGCQKLNLHRRRVLYLIYEDVFPLCTQSLEHNRLDL